jgi:hypothetical protein
MEVAKKIHSCYFPGFAFPEWVLDETLWKNHDFASVKVLYHSQDNLHDVKRLITEREPCNIGMKRLYLNKKLQQEFGYEEGAYRLSTPEKLMPNIAVYMRATVKLQRGFQKVHVIHLIGAAFDHPYQPDFIYFRDKPIEDIIAFYTNMWRLAFEALYISGCKNLQIYNVGGGAFAGPYSGRFTRDIFEPSIKSLLPLFERYEKQILGYNPSTHQFTGGFIPDCLETAELESTLFVNAWDPWSLIGNGNQRDKSLDGYWGRVSNVGVLGWLPTNPSITFHSVSFSSPKVEAMP